MNLIGVFAKTNRRVRLKFSANLAAGAFASTAFYAVTSQDPTAASPGIRAVYAVAGIPNTCELVLAGDLIGQGLYIVTAVGVPSTDTTVTPAGSSETFAFGAPMTPGPNQEPRAIDGDVVLYGRDLVFNGIDFQESPEGDLAIVSGIANAAAALQRRLTGSPLPYAPDYSPNAREFVDGNESLVLRNRIRQQALRDNRVKAVTVVADIDEDGNSVYTVTPIFIGDRSVQPISVAVKT